MKNILMVIHGINFNNGGITKVILNRTHFFNDLGYSSKIITFDGDNDYKNLESELKICGRLHPKAEIVNFFDYYRNKNTKTSIPIFDEELITKQEDLIIQDTFLKNKFFARYFDKVGNLIKCKYFLNDKLSHVEYFEKNKVILKKEYKNDILHKITDFDSSGNDIQVRFFTYDGLCYFQRSYLGNDNKIHLFVFDHINNKVVGFNSYQKLHTHFIEELCISSTKNDNVVICDGPGSAEKVANINSKIAKKILTIHSNHFNSPYVIGSTIKEGILPTLNNIDKVDSIVVLTKSQLKDLTTQFKNSEKFYYIPNTIKMPEEFDKKNYTSEIKKINIISRYVTMKHHEHVIKAIFEIKDKISLYPIELNFYGEGPEKENLKSLIKKLNLENIVSINDYVVDVDSVFREANLTIFTSSYEGFGLTIIESMANKTPVISYDINYGPKDIITDNEDGFLIKFNDIKSLSKTIEKALFNKDSILNDMSENAFNKIKNNFSHEVAMEYWKKLIG